MPKVKSKSVCSGPCPIYIGDHGKSQSHLPNPPIPKGANDRCPRPALPAPTPRFIEKHCISLMLGSQSRLRSTLMLVFLPCPSHLDPFETLPGHFLSSASPSFWPAPGAIFTFSFPPPHTPQHSLKTPVPLWGRDILAKVCVSLAWSSLWYLWLLPSQVDGTLVENKIWLLQLLQKQKGIHTAGNL